MYSMLLETEGRITAPLCLFVRSPDERMCMDSDLHDLGLEEANREQSLPKP